MNVFDNIYEKVKISFNEWIQIVDPKCKWTIEDFPYDTGVDEIKTKPHCWKCVSVNHCWFVNETDKKPLAMNYTLDAIRKLLGNVGTANSLPGLYHPNCHCKEFSISTPMVDNVKLIIPPKKFEWTFKDKGHLLNEMGYREKEFNEAMEILQKIVKQAYASGSYNFRVHDEKGYRIGFVIDFPGKNEDAGKVYKLKTGWTIFPNGKLKNNTLIGGLV